MKRKDIAFAINPVRVVYATLDAFTFVDGTGPHRADHLTRIVDSGVVGVVHHNGALTIDDVFAVRSVLVAIACEAAKCADIAEQYSGNEPHIAVPERIRARGVTS